MSHSCSGFSGVMWMGKWFMALLMVIAVRQTDGDVASVAKGLIGRAPGE